MENKGKGSPAYSLCIRHAVFSSLTICTSRIFVHGIELLSALPITSFDPKRKFSGTKRYKYFPRIRAIDIELPSDCISLRPNDYALVAIHVRA
jgi:hypothetical protein